MIELGPGTQRKLETDAACYGSQDGTDGDARQFIPSFPSHFAITLWCLLVAELHMIPSWPAQLGQHKAGPGLGLGDNSWLYRSRLCQGCVLTARELVCCGSGEVAVVQGHRVVQSCFQSHLHPIRHWE